MKRPVIIIGAGGHGKVLAEVLLSQGITILGFTDVAYEDGKRDFLGFPVLGTDERILSYSPAEVELVNALGSTRSLKKRTAIFVRFKDLGFSFADVRHPAAIISTMATLGEGVQLLAGAIVQPGSTVGANTIINTKVSIDHDCQIGPHVHLAPGVTLSGAVEIGEGVHVGAGATVIQGIRIGPRALVAAGAVVIRDVPAGAKVMGVPARLV